MPPDLFIDRSLGGIAVPRFLRDAWPAPVRTLDEVFGPEQTGGLGLFIRSLVGLDRQAANEAFAAYLDDTAFSVDQVRFVSLIVDELTANGLMEPGRLFESPYTDHAPTGPDYFFPEADVTAIVEVLQDIRKHAVPTDVA